MSILLDRVYDRLRVFVLAVDTNLIELTSFQMSVFPCANPETMDMASANMRTHVPARAGNEFLVLRLPNCAFCDIVYTSGVYRQRVALSKFPGFFFCYVANVFRTCNRNSIAICQHFGLRFFLLIFHGKQDMIKWEKFRSHISAVRFEMQYFLHQMFL